MSKQEIVAAAAAGAGAVLVLQALLQYIKARKAEVEEISTTSSSHSGNVYETDKAVAEYLMFHFGAPSDILPYDNAPHSALEFASRTAKMCVDWAAKQGLAMEAALDVGCAVGRTSFDLTPAFKHVVGVDFSHAFIDAANKLKKSGGARYRMTVEGDVTAEHEAKVPSTAVVQRATFIQGDACALPSNAQFAALGVPGGKFTVIHGANLLCRLPEPMAFLNRLPSLLTRGGLVVFISPYSWLKQYTPKGNWLGGMVDATTGKCRMSFDGLKAAMEANGFKLIHEEQVPFLIREHARKFQWGCSHGTVWQLQG